MVNAKVNEYRVCYGGVEKGQSGASDVDLKGLVGVSWAKKSTKCIAGQEMS